MTEDIRHRFLILGGGPAGNTAATIAASLGAGVTMVEDTVVGGAAHVWDCIPSKAMVASSMRLHAIKNASRLGVEVTESVRPDMGQLAARLDALSSDVSTSVSDMLVSQSVELIKGRGRFTSASTAVAETDDGPIKLGFDSALIATGSTPWQPDWANVDGERILTTRHTYDLPELPEHVVIIGAGVTGVEFVHIFSSLGSEVTLVVSRQQVLPHRDPEVAFVLEGDFLDRGVTLIKGARATAITRDGDGAVVDLQDGRKISGSHALLAVGAHPNTEGIGLEQVGIKTEAGYPVVDEHQRTSVPNIYVAGDVTGQMPLSSVAAMQGRMVARHLLGFTVNPLDFGKMARGRPSRRSPRSASKRWTPPPKVAK